MQKYKGIIRIGKLLPDKIYCTKTEIYVDGIRLQRVYEIQPFDDEIAEKLSGIKFKTERNRFGEVLYAEFEGEVTLTEMENGYSATITRVIKVL